MLMMGCLEEEEGCLDPNALNLDVRATVDANCIYPSLSLNISHLWILGGDTLYLRLNEPVPSMGHTDSLIFRQLAFYVNNAIISPGEGRVLNRLYVNNELNLTDDLAIISPNELTTTFGQIDFHGDRMTMTFDIGYLAQWDQIDSVSAASHEPNHPWNDRRLVNQRKHLWFNMIVDVVNDTDTVQRVIQLAGPEAIPIQGNLYHPIIQATNYAQSILLDYAVLFADLDLRFMSDAEIESSIAARINQAVFFVP